MIFFFFCSCDDQETGVAGGFWAGWIVAADEDNDRSSGFGEGYVSISKSCVSNVGCKVVGLGDIWDGWLQDGSPPSCFLKGQLGGMVFFRMKMCFKQYNEWWMTR